jgi:hypothetical protein
MSGDQTMSVENVERFHRHRAGLEHHLLLREEARRRGLDIQMWLEQPSRDIIIRWRPAPSL